MASLLISFCNIYLVSCNTNCMKNIKKYVKAIATKMNQVNWYLVEGLFSLSGICILQLNPNYL